MKFYKPVATYHDADSISMLFPSADIKPDLADIIYRHWNNVHDATMLNADDESYVTDQDINGDSCFCFTSDMEHAVRLTRGNANLLRKQSDDHGFYIDIYDRVEPEDVPQGVLELNPQCINTLVVQSDVEDLCMSFYDLEAARSEMKRQFNIAVDYVIRSGFESDFEAHLHPDDFTVRYDKSGGKTGFEIVGQIYANTLI